MSKTPRIGESPRRIALEQHLIHPGSYIAYALIILGLVLLTQSPERKVLGASLSIGVAILFFGYRYQLSSAFIWYCEDSLQHDLGDIACHYKLQPIRPNVEELVPSGPSGFWVVEREYPDKNDREIVGCVALGVVIRSYFDQADNLSYRLPSERRNSARRTTPHGCFA